ncbi:MAG: hypothetical protein JRJ59_02170 [Deltaproteobacteria bacterium]|nr:hypothetical protein [Deltaproteobacteria bacterium]
MIRRVVWLLGAALFLAACAPVSPPPGPKNLVRVKPAKIQALADDLEPASLEKAIEQSLVYLRRLPPERPVSLL